MQTMQVQLTNSLNVEAHSCVRALTSIHTKAAAMEHTCIVYKRDEDSRHLKSWVKKLTCRAFIKVTFEEFDPCNRNVALNEVAVTSTASFIRTRINDAANACMNSFQQEADTLTHLGLLSWLPLVSYERPLELLGGSGGLCSLHKHLYWCKRVYGTWPLDLTHENHFCSRIKAVWGGKDSGLKIVWLALCYCTAIG